MAGGKKKEENKIKKKLIKKVLWFTLKNFIYYKVSIKKYTGRFRQDLFS